MARAWPRLPLPPLGARVSVAGLYVPLGGGAVERLAHGTVRFTGKLAYTDGMWVGVDLDDPVGKHQGALNGKVYFECKEGHQEGLHGTFVRPEEIRILEEEPEIVRSTFSPSSPAWSSVSRPGSAALRQGPQRRQPAAANSMLRRGRSATGPSFDGAAASIVADLKARLDAEEKQRFALQARLQAEERHRQDLQEGLSSAWSSLLLTKKKLQQCEREQEAAAEEFRLQRAADQHALRAAQEELRKLREEVSSGRSRAESSRGYERADTSSQSPSSLRGGTQRTRSAAALQVVEERQQVRNLQKADDPLVLGDAQPNEVCGELVEPKFKVAVWDWTWQENLLDFFPKPEHCSQDLRDVLEIAHLVLQSRDFESTLEDMVLALHPDGPLPLAQEFELSPITDIPEGLEEWLASKQDKWPEQLQGMTPQEAAAAWCKTPEIRWSYWKTQMPMDWLDDDRAGGSTGKSGILGLSAAESALKAQNRSDLRGVRSRFWSTSSTSKDLPLTGQHDFFKLAVWDILLEYIFNLEMDEDLPAEERRNVEDALLPAMTSLVPTPGTELGEDRKVWLLEEARRCADVVVLLHAPKDLSKTLSSVFWVVAPAASPTILLSKELFEEPALVKTGFAERLTVCTTRPLNTGVSSPPTLKLVGASLPSDGESVSALARAIEPLLQDVTLLLGGFDEDWSDQTSRCPPAWRDCPESGPVLSSFLRGAHRLTPGTAKGPVNFSPLQVQHWRSGEARVSQREFFFASQDIQATGNSLARVFSTQRPFERARLEASVLWSTGVECPAGPAELSGDAGPTSPRMKARIIGLQGPPVRRGFLDDEVGGAGAAGFGTADQPSAWSSGRRGGQNKDDDNDWHQVSSDEEQPRAPARLSVIARKIDGKANQQDLTGLSELYSSLKSEMQRIEETQAKLLQDLSEGGFQKVAVAEPEAADDEAAATQKLEGQPPELASTMLAPLSPVAPRDRKSTSIEDAPASERASQTWAPQKYIPLTIGLIGARGLINADEGASGFSDPYCVCQVVGKPHTLIKTKAIRDTLEPIWKHADEMPEYCEGDVLEFKVFDKDPGELEEDDFLGRAELVPKQIFPNGFDGELALSMPPGSVDGESFLRVMVKAKPKRPSLQPYEEPVEELRNIWKEASVRPDRPDPPSKPLAPETPKPAAKPAATAASATPSAAAPAAATTAGPSLSPPAAPGAAPAATLAPAAGKSAAKADATEPDEASAAAGEVLPFSGTHIDQVPDESPSFTS